MKPQAPSFAHVAALNKAAGDVLRLQVLRVLAQDAFGVLELCQIFDYRQSGMSHHLKVLAEVDLVAKRREGNSIFYSRSVPVGSGCWMAMQQQLFNTVDELGLPDEIQARVKTVKLERAEQSQVFFEQHVEKFREQQDLIADYPTYGEAIAGLLAKVTIADPVAKKQLAVEIGSGQGEFLPILSAEFSEVIALDNSPALLEKAKAYCHQQKLTNVEFVCNDTSYLQGKHSANCVVMNMVLHHTPSPADIFQDIAQGLKPGGVLLVTELCRHDQDWAKTSCGDLWLGFDPKELHHWADLAGLTTAHSHYFALRNGFQVQLQQFVKAA